MSEPIPPAPESATQARVIGVALAIPEPYGSLLQAHRESFGDPLARQIPTHITLLAPLTVDASLLPEIEAHLGDVAAAGVPFEIELRGTATFRPVSPVVFVQLSRGISSCEWLERRVRSGLLARELTFPYHPHVTVAHDLDDAALDLAFQTLATFSAEFSVTGFCLFEHIDGVWRPKREFPLGRSGGS